MATKLGLWNAALRELGERKLASLTEAREPRRVLDDIYDDALQFCLEQGQWNFAIRTVEVTEDTGLSISFGYAYGFVKPSDWIRTAGLAADERFSIPLVDYKDEKGYWWADVTPLYVRYVSNDPSYGLDLTAWPQTFTRYVELYLAERIAVPVTSSRDTRDAIKKEAMKALTDARSKDAMNDPVAFPPTGSWARSRVGSQNYKRYDRA